MSSLGEKPAEGDIEVELESKSGDGAAKSGSVAAGAQDATATSASRASAAAAEDDGEPDHVDVSKLVLPAVSLGDDASVVRDEDIADVRFSERAKVFVFVPHEVYGDEVRVDQWKRRGVGTLKVLRHHSTGRSTVVFREDKTGMVRASFLVVSELVPHASSDKAVTVSAADFSEGNPPSQCTLAIMFASEETAAIFSAAYSDARAANMDALAAAAAADAASSDAIHSATALTDVYSEAAAEAAAARYRALHGRYSALFGRAPEFFVRAPGRVNLIGEHIDYHGYSVLPMAVESDVAIAGGMVREESKEAGTSAGACAWAGVVTVANLDEAFDTRELAADPEAAVDTARHHWTNYVHCGFKGALLSLAEAADAATRAKADAPPTADGLRLVVSGSVPRAAGLSSSSALVVASALATSRALGLGYTRSEVAELTRKSEQFVGTMGGGMDQAISCLAERGAAKHIAFGPLKATTVRLPDGVVFVVANSMAQAEKAVTAVGGYNKRVVEGRLAAKLMAKAHGIEDWKDGVTTLLDLERRLAGSGVTALSLCDAHLKEGPHSKAELAEALGVEVTQPALFADRPAAAAVLEANDDFYLRDRARHVYLEAERVSLFRDICAGELPPAAALHGGEGDGPADVAEALGMLMNASHESCSKLYECSCPELDQLTALARANGALGSRLTGAGWGGCTVSIVREADAERLLAALRESYFGPREVAAEELPAVLFATKPAGGIAMLPAAVGEAR